ncbi:MAG: response regulator [Deferribacteraceae bacterium]|nr:response regulator [Deferribacteraceae bacterium]
MSIRIKIVVAVVSVITLVSAANLGIGLLFTQERLNESMVDNLGVLADITDRLITKEIDLLESEVSSMGYYLSEVHGEGMEAALERQLNANPYLMSLAVFNSLGVEAAIGGAPDYPNNAELNRAFGGEEVISSNYWSETAEKLVAYIYVPMGERVLAAGISGMHFTDLLEKFRIWETGDIYIIDSKGMLLASAHREIVENRVNYIELAKIDDTPNIKELGEVSKVIIKGERGLISYSFKGEKRLCLYTPITGSRAGWLLGVAAPVKESPVALVHHSLIIAQAIFLVLGILAAFLFSDKLALHFKKIEEKNAHLAELNCKVKTASEAKSMFLANTSHEMRTPLNAIVGLSELMLKAGNIKGESGKELEKIHDAGMTLLAIVNDLLDLSKVESGKFELVTAEYDVPSLINDTVTASIMRIEEKPISLNLLMDWDMPSKLLGDELRIKQIINNLLSNAFKYTIEGRVTLSVMCEIEGKDVWMTIRVVDEGIGIREEDLAKLFSEYNQVDTKSNRRIEGTGLGLAITKKLAEMMDGTITVESVYGEGSTFTVRIKQGFVSEDAIGRDVAEDLKNFCYTVKKRNKNAKLVRAFLPNAKVLVVDDVENNLYVAKGMLKTYGMRVDCAKSGREAIAKIRDAKVVYNAVFMDHMMPDMDGIETVRIIRGLDSAYARNIPIIALTANAIKGSEEHFLKNGFQAFLSKPIDIKTLDDIVKQWIVAVGETEIESGSETSVPLGAREKLEEIGLNVDECLIRFNGDWKTLTDVLRSFAVSTSELLFQFQEIKEERLRDYAILLHGVKGSCRGICVEFLGNLAEDLEHAANSHDTDFVEQNCGEFLAETAKFINTLSNVLNEIEGENPKPEKDVPAPDLLEKLAEYCNNFDMDGIDEVMTELDSYSYRSGRDLIQWLKNRIERLEFPEIRERLSFTLSLF